MKTILIWSVFMTVICLVIGVTLTVLFHKDVKLVPLPSPSTDASQAFPQYDQIYRDKGSVTSIRKSKILVFDYLQFHEDGTVVSTTRSLTSMKKLNDAFYEDLAEELAIDGKGRLRRHGRYLIEDGEVGYALGLYESDITEDMPLNVNFDVFYGEIRGDQIWTKYTQGKDKEPYGGFYPFAPVGPEAHWKTMEKD